MRHFVSAEQVSPAMAEDLIKRALALKAGATPHFQKNSYVSNLFFENSTRTHTSFEMAERKLAMPVISFAPEASSINKGETLADTVKTLAAIGVKVAVIRHAEDNYYQQLIDSTNQQIHIINAGDGAGQHPSQMMLDLMTIFEEFGHFAGLRVGIVGDLRHSRVAKSDMQMLKKLGVQLSYAGPEAWLSPEFAELGTKRELAELVPDVDVIMLLRVQLERLQDLEVEHFAAASYHQRFGLTTELAELLPKQAIIMHPAPVNRDVELASELVEAPNSRIFRQMENGVYMRMAMLEWVLAEEGEH